MSIVNLDPCTLSALASSIAKDLSCAFNEKEICVVEAFLFSILQDLRLIKSTRECRLHSHEKFKKF